MADKDNWDKLEVVIKVAAAIIIPVALAYSANRIADSMKRAELVRSFNSDLSQQTSTKRDIALIALDSAIPIEEKCRFLETFGCERDPDHDQVVQLAIILSKEAASEKAASRIEVAKNIIIDRSSSDKDQAVGYYEAKLGGTFDEEASLAQANVISNADWQAAPTNLQAKANVSQTIAALQAPPTKLANDQLRGVRLVYIQYGSDKEPARKVQTDLVGQSVSAPGLQHVDGIDQNSIRYAGPIDKDAAERLQDYLQKTSGISVDRLIDLSRVGYKVPSGQFEVWLK